MTLAQFFGCGMIAFGPPVTMFILTIAHDPIRIIMLVASAFFWLLSLLFSSMLFTFITSLQDTIAFATVFSVIFQEIFRFLWFLLIKKAEVGLLKVSEENIQIVENKHILAYVSGLGFGMISGVFSLVNLLADMTGPGTIGLHGEPKTFFVASSLTSLAFILLHIFWGILFFNALHKKIYLQLAYVVLSHLFVSCITLLNPLYVVTVISIWALTLISACLAFIVAGGTYKNLQRALKLSARVIEVQPPTVQANPNAS